MKLELGRIKMAEYILKADAIKAIENDCSEYANYSQEDAIACLNALDSLNLIETGVEFVSDNQGSYYVTKYETPRKP